MKLFVVTETTGDYDDCLTTVEAVFSSMHKYFDWVDSLNRNHHSYEIVVQYLDSYEDADSVKLIDSFEHWKLMANHIGWTHCHDNVVVCDDESGLVLGEFIGERGWILSSYYQENYNEVYQ